MVGLKTKDKNTKVYGPCPFVLRTKVLSKKHFTKTRLNTAFIAKNCFMPLVLFQATSDDDGKV